MDPDAVAKAFVEHYYTTFDSNRAGLVSLYQEGSMLSFEGQKIQGSQNIVAKLTSLPFQQRKHNITTVDCQPSGPANGMLVFVSGNLQLAGEQHALKFSQGTRSLIDLQLTRSFGTFVMHSVIDLLLDVPFGIESGKLLRVQRHIQVELCLRIVVAWIYEPLFQAKRD
uniref:NTF2 domain-containing protein n=1 Tax=Brassica campestris TaxID=3711 RepID=M4EML5_BRACM